MSILLAVAISPASAATPVRTPDASTPPGMLVSVGTHALHIHCVGSGSPTVVFEAGLGSTSMDWSRVQPRVGRFTRSCSYDRGGYGWSESGPLPRHAQALSGELERLLVYASLHPPYVMVAHSFGGFPVRLFAHRNPGKMAGLVLVDTTHEQQFKRFNTGARKPLVPTGRSFFIANHWEVADGLPRELRNVARALARKRRAVRALYAEMVDMRRSATQVMDRPLLPRIPIHVVARQPAAVSPPRQAAERRWLQAQHDLANRLPDASLHLAAGSGHHVQLDAPELVVNLIRSVVQHHEATGECPPPPRPTLHAVRGGLKYAAPEAGSIAPGPSRPLGILC